MAVTERVQIIININGSTTVRRELDSVGRSARNSADGVDMLRGALTAWVSSSSLATIARYGDAFTNITNRLKVVTDTTAELTTAQERLYTIAQDARTGFESVATVYARTAQATEALGYTAEDAARFTEQLAKSTALSSVSAETANAALVQLSQGLASGTLRGEELNSLLEQLPYAANALAEGLGVTVGQLRELGQAGAITPQQIIDAFNRMNASITADFAQMTPTISQGLTVINNGFIQLAGLLETNVGIFGMVATGLVWVGDNLTLVLAALSPVIAAFTVLAIEILGTLVINAMTSAVASIGAMVAGLGRLAVGLAVVVPRALMFAAALAVNPITLWTVAITAAIAIIGSFVAYLLYGEEGLQAFADKAMETAAQVKEYFNDLFIWKDNGNPEIQFRGEKAAADLKAAGADIAKQISGAAKGGDIAKPIEKALTKGAGDIQKGIEKGSSTGSTMLEKVNAKGADKMGAAMDKAQQKQTNINDVFVAKFEGTGRNIYDLWNNWGNAFIDGFKTRIGDLLVQFQRAQTEALEAQAELYRAQAEQFRLQNEYLKRNGELPGTATSGGSSGSSDRGSSGGGDSRTSGTTLGGGRMPRGGAKTVSLGTNTGETTVTRTVEPATPIINQPTNAQASPKANAPQINNIFDPRSMLDVMQTAEGRDVILNLVKTNRDEMAALLGVA